LKPLRAVIGPHGRAIKGRRKVTDEGRSLPARLRIEPAQLRRAQLTAGRRPARHPLEPQRYRGVRPHGASAPRRPAAASSTPRETPVVEFAADLPGIFCTRLTLEKLTSSWGFDGHESARGVPQPSASNPDRALRGPPRVSALGEKPKPRLTFSLPPSLRFEDIGWFIEPGVLPHSAHERHASLPRPCARAPQRANAARAIPDAYNVARALLRLS